MAGVIRDIFPSQVASDLEKMSMEYGFKVGKAIENEWFNNSNNYNRGNRYASNKNNFHNLRLYTRGEQSIQKYKDELSINGDLSYLNLDWTPVPIIPKFVDIVVNGIAERMYTVKATSQDQYGVSKRTEYMESLLGDVMTSELSQLVEAQLGVNLNENQGPDLPRTKEELDLYMQLTYKQGVELAEEQAINVLMEGNRYELIKKRFYYDLTVLVIGAVKTGFSKANGVTIDYVDPANLVYSYTESPYFDDVYYVGEVKQIPINELVKQFPHLTHSQLEEITKGKSTQSRYLNNFSSNKDEDDNKV